MDSEIVIFWLVCLSCVTGLVMTRVQSGSRGLVVAYLLILAVCGAGKLLGRSLLIYASGVMWLGFALIPGLLSRVYFRCLLQQRFGAARRLARLIGWLHPVGGWGQLTGVIRAQELAQRGDFASALKLLECYEQDESAAGLSATAQAYRLSARWEDLLVWAAQHEEVGRYPSLLPMLLRARGEVGDMVGLVELYDRFSDRIGRLTAPGTRDMCRLMLFAFCGRRDLVERLFSGTLSLMSIPVQRFWLATSEMANGHLEEARQQLEHLLPTAEPVLRLDIERRLARSEAVSAMATAFCPVGSEPNQTEFGSAAALPTGFHSYCEHVLERAALEHGHDERFGAQPSLFSRRALATQLLILANIAMFIAEICLGGSTNPDAWFRLGMLVPEAVSDGQWWRLITANFLHAGILHLVMNMIGLWILGPFVELALGFRKYLLLYLLTGIGSMGLVMLSHRDDAALGASGCVMGLVGATAALMLRGWMRHRARAARQRLVTMGIIIFTQTIFDAVTPEVSMTAHLSGAVLGFLAVLVAKNVFEIAPFPGNIRPRI